MARLIRLCYRKIIDASATRRWDQLVWEDSYRELRLQAQTFDPAQRHRTFGELLHHVPGASQLHFLVSAAVGGYLQQLNDMVPDIADNLGRLFLKFTQYRFEVINSDLRDAARHQVAVNFVSNPLLWHEAIGQYLLVSDPATPAEAGATLTHLVAVQPFLSIYSLQAEGPQPA